VHVRRSGPGRPRLMLALDCRRFRTANGVTGAAALFVRSPRRAGGPAAEHCDATSHVGCLATSPRAWSPSRGRAEPRPGGPAARVPSSILLLFHRVGGGGGAGAGTRAPLCGCFVSVFPLAARGPGKAAPKVVVEVVVEEPEPSPPRGRIMPGPTRCPQPETLCGGGLGTFSWLTWRGLPHPTPREAGTQRSRSGIFVGVTGIPCAPKCAWAPWRPGPGEQPNLMGSSYAPAADGLITGHVPINSGWR